MGINDKSLLFGDNSFPEHLPLVYNKRKHGEQGMPDRLEAAFAAAQKFEGLPRIDQVSVESLLLAGTTGETGAIVLKGSDLMGNMVKAAVTLGASLAVVTSVKPGVAGNALKIAITDGATGNVTVGLAAGITTITYDANTAADTYNNMATAINADGSAASYANRYIDVVGSATAIAAAMAATALVGGEGVDVDVVYGGTDSLMVDNAAGLSCTEWTATQITLADYPTTTLAGGDIEVYVNGALGNVTHLAISNGIFLGTPGAELRGHIGCASLVFSAQPNAADTIDIGADVYEFDGAGVNINVAIGGSAAVTLATFVAAINASGTEAVFAEALGTDLVISNATIPGGEYLEGNQNIVLAEAITDIADIWDKDNLNDTGATSYTNKAEGSFTATAIMVAAGSPFKVRLPFAAAAASILYKLDNVDTFAARETSATVAVNGTDATILDFDLDAGGAAVVATDVVYWVAHD